MLTAVKTITKRFFDNGFLAAPVVRNGSFNVGEAAAGFDGNPFLLFWGGGESSGWPTKRGEGKRPILRMASQSSLFCSDSSTAAARFVLCTVVGRLAEADLQ